MASEGENEPSRAVKMLRAGKDLPYPPLETTREMSEYIVDLGGGIQTGMGLVPLSSLELRSWLEGTGVELSSWQFNTILEASRALVGQYNSSDGEKKPPPWANEDTIKDHRKTVSDQMRSVMEGLMEAQKNKPTRRTPT